MKNKLAFKLAIKNLAGNRILGIPFFISTSIMMALFFITVTLTSNDYVLTRHATLPTLINFAVIILGIFSSIFIIYAGRIRLKRRNKEFALYGILGLEKRHIAKVIFLESLFEYIATSLSSVVLGYIIGKIAFLGLNRMMKDKMASLMDYDFSILAVILTIGLLAVIFLIIHLVSVVRIHISSPMELMMKQKSGEGEPKVKWLIAILGVTLLLLGYGIALWVKGNLESLGAFFIAAILVIFGTYFLFMAISIAILKALKMNKNFYYKAKHFISISGMLYRMKANAVGLASITVLSTAIIITLIATSSIYTGINTKLANFMSTDFMAEYYIDNSEISEELIAAKKDELISKVKSSAETNKLKDMVAFENFMTPVIDDNSNVFKPADSKAYKDGYKSTHYLTVRTLKGHNAIVEKEIDLADDEILLGANSEKLLESFNEKKIVLADKAYKVKKFNSKYSSNVAVETYDIIVPNYEVFRDMNSYYKSLNQYSGKDEASAVTVSVAWNIDKDISHNSNEYSNYVRNTRSSLEDEGISFEERENVKKTAYELNGGFLFLGILIGGIFLVGTVLITYYKQVSEGYEDRESYGIMRKVGLPNKLIKKSSRNQILWMFFLPVVVAVIHTLVASKIVFQMLRIFGVDSLSMYLTNAAIVITAFAFVYMVVFLITSKMYYRIVR